MFERIRFLAIFTSNLDEFYMVRVASLKRKIEAGVANVNSAGYAPREQMKVLLERTHELVERQSKCFHKTLIPELSKVGVNFLTWDDLSESEIVYLQDLFTAKIYPVLTPLGVDPAHPFPHISGLSLNIGIQLRNPESLEEFFARVKIPLNLPRFIATADGAKNRYIPLELLIRKKLNQLFPDASSGKKQKNTPIMVRGNWFMPTSSRCSWLFSLWCGSCCLTTFQNVSASTPLALSLLPMN